MPSNFFPDFSFEVALSRVTLNDKMVLYRQNGKLISFVEIHEQDHQIFVQRFFQLLKLKLVPPHLLHHRRKIRPLTQVTWIVFGSHGRQLRFSLHLLETVDLQNFGLEFTQVLSDLLALQLLNWSHRFVLEKIEDWIQVDIRVFRKDCLHIAVFEHYRQLLVLNQLVK